ncbi:MAG TPA: hypothetical protein VE944_10910 [Nostoc sp.]|uniref:hypothetical protein n=1 Tax=Nostoc sp. TaxID=1180 RepID=UPI002D25575B|nr:hypothetical protein [Nostoc sp.]HYX14854.1 hypothetical protein [Nostoc sp.]
MLSTKENLKQIEMDTIQQEPLLTELTPEAAATVEGGILRRVNVDRGNLNIRSTPFIPTPSNANIIGSIPNSLTIDVTNIVRGGFRRLTARTTRLYTQGRSSVGWVANRLLE